MSFWDAPKANQAMLIFLKELLASFFLCFVGVFALQQNVEVAAVLMSLTAAACYFGSEDRIALNPSVSIALWIQNKIGVATLWQQIAGQVTGALMAATMSTFLLKHMGMHDTPTFRADQSDTFILESFFTFGLVFWGLAGTNQPRVGVGAAIFYGVSLAACGNFMIIALNPALVLAFTTINILKIDFLWVHLAGSIFGGLAAGSVLVALYGRKADFLSHN
jgi:glycerol uptake facilitator-like aquaporin